VATALGVFAADLVWMAASLAGVTAVLVASEPAFLAIRYIGATYLVYIGVRLLTSRASDPHPEPGDVATSNAGMGRALRRGVICDLSNPKTLLVFTSVIPQFLTTGSHIAYAALLGLTFALVGLVSLAVYGAVAIAARRSMGSRRRVGQLFARASGGVLVLFGVGLAADTP
jgi:threonine/homoserine/homoserine lactone efflux protein